VPNKLVTPLTFVFDNWQASRQKYFPETNKTSLSNTKVSVVSVPANNKTKQHTNFSVNGVFLQLTPANLARMMLGAW